ncbi:MAG: ABC transporter substrate-binding protein [Clostridiales bacterium]|nr:ABC transporter substrate-binding protein [Clostridiales bacterium]
MKKIAVILAALMMLLGLSACQTAGGGEQADGAEKVTFVLDWTPNTNHTGVYVALEKGYFADAGLDVEIIQPPEEGALPLVASGKAQFCVTFQENIAEAITSTTPMDVKAVAAILQHNTSGIISLKEDGINSPKDMENKVYATWDTPVEKAILKQVITKDGGDFEKVEMVPATVTDVVSALQANVDAVWIYYGWEGIAAELADLDTNYFYFKDIDPVLDFYTPVIASSNAYLNEHPDTAKAFLAACDKGYEYAIKNPGDAAKILIEHASGVDPELATESQKYMSEQYRAEADRWGVIDQARWDAFYGWMYENELIPTKIEPGGGFTNEYLPE